MARDIKFLVKDIQAATVEAAQEACVEIMNGLVEAGPGYSGAFSSAWYAVPAGSSAGGPRSSGSLYRYDKRNVPKTRFTAGTLYQIVNGASYAAEAMDLVPGRFESQLDERDPVKDPVAVGSRFGTRRGEVRNGPGFAISTAELDWWDKYNAAGSLSKDLAKGVRQGFGKARGFGR